MNGTQFYATYNNRTVIDDGPILSKEFKKFARDMKSALRFELTALGVEIVNYSVGHYDVSGFCKRDNKTVYFSYSMPRYSSVDLDTNSYLNGFLYRSAKDEKDYHGGNNNFCSWKELAYKIDALLRSMA